MTGRIIKCVGGLYEVENEAGGESIRCRARGAIRHTHLKTLIGDRVTLTRERDGDWVIEEILPRRNALIRPPLANLDDIFIVIAAAHPAPSLTLTDKLISIAEFSGIEPMIIVTKNDLDGDTAKRITAIYQRAGFTVFETSSASSEGVESLRAWIAAHLFGHVATVAGVSGAGKSTLLNALFPSLALETGGLSERIERGKNTTRHTELFRLSALLGCTPPACGEGYIADTPGFSLIDFTRFDFYAKEDLPGTFREFAPYLGQCRYTKCTHQKEDGCAILEAVKRGEIAPERHASFAEIYRDIKDKHAWDHKV